MVLLALDQRNLTYWARKTKILLGLWNLFLSCLFLKYLCFNTPELTTTSAFEWFYQFQNTLYSILSRVSLIHYAKELIPNHLPILCTLCEEYLYSEFFWSVFSRIWTENDKIQSRKTANMLTFSALIEKCINEIDLLGWQTICV